MQDRDIQQERPEDDVGRRQISGTIVGAVVGALISIPLWVVLAVLVTGGFEALGAMGILGAVKVGLAWGLVLGGYVGLMLTGRQQQLRPSTR